MGIISALLLTTVLLGPVESSGLDIEAVNGPWVPRIVGDEADTTPAKPEPSTPVTPEPVSVGLFINEFMASNGGAVQGPNGTYPDWIELFNGGNETINLGGMYLTDDPSMSQFWQIPNGTSIAQKSHLLIWADQSYDQGALHTGFALNASGGVIGLFASDGATLIDSVEYGIQIRDVSYGRVTDGGSTWNNLLVSTPGSANQQSSSATPAEVWPVWLFIITALSVCILVAIKFKAREREKQ